MSTSSPDRQARLDAERIQIQTAASRILSGTPTCSSGAITISGLALEAGLPRHRLYEHHADLLDEFKTSAAGGPISPNHRALQRQLDEADGRIRDLERRNDRLRRQVNTLAAIITELELSQQGAAQVVAFPRHRI